MNNEILQFSIIISPDYTHVEINEPEKKGVSN
jgi:hypothetical protein